MFSTRQINSRNCHRLHSKSSCEQSHVCLLKKSICLISHICNHNQSSVTGVNVNFVVLLLIMFWCWRPVGLSLCSKSWETTLQIPSLCSSVCLWVWFWLEKWRSDFSSKAARLPSIKLSLPARWVGLTIRALTATTHLELRSNPQVTLQDYWLHWSHLLKSCVWSHLSSSHLQTVFPVLISSSRTSHLITLLVRVQMW